MSGEPKSWPALVGTDATEAEQQLKAEGNEFLNRKF